MYIFICICVCVARILVLIWLAFKLCVWCFCIKNWVKHCKNISLSFAVCRLCHAWSLVVWLLSCVPLLVTPWTAARQASLSFTISRSLLKHAHWVGDAIRSSRPLLSTSLPTFYLSQHQGLFQWVSSSQKYWNSWPKYWSFSFSIGPSNEYSGLIFFKINWLDLLAVQGILKSILQHHSSKVSIFQCSVFFMVQLSHPYTTTGKTIALTTQT